MGNILGKVVGMMGTYVKNWKSGAGIIFITLLVFSMAGFIGYSTSLLITWLFNIKHSTDWISLGVITLSPFYVGLCRDSLKGFFINSK